MSETDRVTGGAVLWVLLACAAVLGWAGWLLDAVEMQVAAGAAGVVFVALAWWGQR